MATSAQYIGKNTIVALNEITFFQKVGNNLEINFKGSNKLIVECADEKELNEQYERLEGYLDDMLAHRDQQRIDKISALERQAVALERQATAMEERNARIHGISYP